MKTSWQVKHTLFLILAGCILLASTAWAEKIYLAAGESRVINTKENIDTVFVSSSELADYEIISDTNVVIYAKKEGVAEFTVFNKEGKTIFTESVIINDLLRNIDKQIRSEYPDSHVVIQKIAKTYILTGTVPTEEARDHIYKIVGEGIGAKKKEIDLKYESESGKNTDRLTFLDKVFYEQVINKLKVPVTNQVNVKLTIAEVTKEFVDNVGIDWHGGINQPGTFILQKFKFNAQTMVNVINAINNTTVARVLAEPNLSVLSGERADFLVGGEFPLSTTNPLGVTTIVYKDFGIKLLIGAKVDDKNRIRVMLSEEVSSIVPRINTDGDNTYPTLSTRRAKTTVELADGDSFLLGGLISNEERESLAKIPFIGDIPILGALFRHTETGRKRTELVVVATVNLVKPISTKDIVLPNFMRTSTAERFFNFSSISQSYNKKQAMEFLSRGGFIR